MSPVIDPRSYSRLAVQERNGDRQAQLDAIAEEVPIALEYNGVAHAVMFATPADVEDFARGFTCSEGIVEDASQIYDLEIDSGAAGIRVALSIASERFMLLKERRRALTGRTGCGLCGVESLAHAMRTLRPVSSPFGLTADAICGGMAALREQQALMQQTGAVHAAGWLDASGALVLVREDVGRHNALDKLIGASAAKGLDLTQGAALITSRASFEMVQKTVTMGVPILAAVSAPTALAVRMAEHTQQALLAFVRAERYACYSASWRLHSEAPHGGPVTCAASSSSRVARA